MKHRFDMSALAISVVALSVALAGTGTAVFLLPEGSVDTEQIRDQAVTNSRLANNSVGTKKLRDGAVTATKIKDGTILGQDFNWTLWRDIAMAGGQAGPAGAAGAPGAPGAPGAAGSMGAQGLPGPSGGTSVLNGVGVPAASTGKDGDFYVDTSTNTMYGPKTSGAWGSGIGLVGPQGPAGPTGPSVLNGSGAPAGGTGKNGDFYIDTSASTIYGPKTGGAWGAGTSLLGPPGPTGATGAQGPTGATGAQGPAGTSVLNGTGAPGAGTGSDGDFYIDTAGDDLYGPKTAGSWGGPTSLVGPQGPQGSTGAPGPQGAPGTSVLSGPGTPGAGTGADGDFYIDTTTYDLYGPKTAGAWGTGVSLVGPAGTQVLNGAGPPAAGAGTDGDFYIDTAANVLYGPKASGAWGAGTSLVGPAGTSVLNGSGAPAAGTGGVGDFYIDTTSNTLYGPKTAGGWGAGTSLVGPAGPGVQPYSAQFSSSETQNSGLVGAVTPITYNSSDVIGVGVNPVGAFPAASLLVANAGRYNMQFSAQLEKTTAGTDIVYIWPQTAAYSGGACGTWASVPDSASSGRQTAAGTRMIMTVNFLIDLSDSTCVRLVMNSTATTNPAEVRLLSEPAVAPVPAVPSIITNIWRIG